MSEPITIPPKTFSNWYEVLGVPLTASADDLNRAYHVLLSRFRAENKETADPRRLHEVKSAFNVLSDPERRKAFDKELSQQTKEQPKESIQPAKDSTPVYLSKDFIDSMELEKGRRLAILCVLYNQRKINPINASLTIPQLETLTSTTREHMEFAIWYLKKRGLILADDRSTVQIESEGIDWLEEHLPRQAAAHKSPRSNKESQAA